MENIKSEISQILFWLDELDTIKTYYFWLDTNVKLLFTPPRLRLKSRSDGMEKDIELSEWAKTMFYDWLTDQEEHINSLIAEKDKDLVETARAIKDGKIRYKEPR